MPPSADLLVDILPLFVVRGSSFGETCVRMWVSYWLRGRHWRSEEKNGRQMIRDSSALGIWAACSPGSRVI